MALFEEVPVVKKIKYVLLSLSLILLAPSVHAYSALYMTHDAAVALVGEKGTIMLVKDSTAKPAKLANGWTAQECVFKGVVLKGNEKLKASDEEQTFTFYVMSSIKGVMPCRNGMKGIYPVFGESKMGLTSIAGGENGSVEFVEGPDGKTYSSKPLRITNKAMATKFSAMHPVAAKTLGTSRTVAPPVTTGAPGARGQKLGPSFNESLVFSKFLIKEYWGTPQ